MSALGWWRRESVGWMSSPWSGCCDRGRWWPQVTLRLPLLAVFTFRGEDGYRGQGGGREYSETASVQYVWEQPQRKYRSVVCGTSRKRTHGRLFCSYSWQYFRPRSLCIHGSELKQKYRCDGWHILMAATVENKHLQCQRLL